MYIKSDHGETSDSTFAECGKLGCTSWSKTAGISKITITGKESETCCISLFIYSPSLVPAADKGLEANGAFERPESIGVGRGYGAGSR